MDGPTRPELMTARAEATGDAARQAADAEALLFGASARGDVEGLRALIVGGAELEAKEAMRAVHTRCSQRQHSRRAAAGSLPQHSFLCTQVVVSPPTARRACRRSLGGSGAGASAVGGLLFA